MTVMGWVQLAALITVIAGTVWFSLGLNRDYIAWHNGRFGGSRKALQGPLFGFELWLAQVEDDMSASLSVRLRVHKLVFTCLILVLGLAA
ncbi:MAG: hypothetical protein JF615_05100, partial [Asticcacaulis sp.]|nr:hypothetical protein [Asticcacaulis sp.]